MANYIVSARKYRPISFDSLLGQDNIALTLKNSITRNQLAHAYLFCGPRGVGKTSTARIFAKTINCLNPKDGIQACEECKSCVSFKEGRSYCIHELDAASNNGVEDIKLLMEKVQIPPQIGKYSVFIIDEVHMLSSSAFNAFLKTLEEPPAHAIFILATTEKHKILPTILSRCQTFDFNRISVNDIVKNLQNVARSENITIEDESLHIIAQKADGAMRDALTIFDQTIAFCGNKVEYKDVLRNLNVLDKEYSFKLLDCFIDNDYRTALLSLDEILARGFNELYFISELSSHLRNLIVCKSQCSEALLDVPESLKTKYLQQAEKCSIQLLYECLNITNNCEINYKNCVNTRVHLEFTLMKLCFLGNGFIKNDTLQEHNNADNVSKNNPLNGNAQSDNLPKGNPQRDNPPNGNLLRGNSLSGNKKEEQGEASFSPLSLSNIIKEVKEENSPTTIFKETSAIPSDDEILLQWGKLIEHYSSKPRLANTLKNAQLNIENNDGCKVLKFSVLNLAQQKWIEEKLLGQIEAILQNGVNSKKLRLEISVLPQERVIKTIYTPEEQARELIKQNEEVNLLVKDLDLDLR